MFFSAPLLLDTLRPAIRNRLWQLVRRAFHSWFMQCHRSDGYLRNNFLVTLQPGIEHSSPLPTMNLVLSQRMNAARSQQVDPRSHPFSEAAVSMATAWANVFTTLAVTRNCFTIAGEDIRLLAMTVDDPMADPGPVEKEFFDCDAAINMWFANTMRAKAVALLQSVGIMEIASTARLILMTAALRSWIFKW